jgi:hypothetical protein
LVLTAPRGRRRVAARRVERDVVQKEMSAMADLTPDQLYAAIKEWEGTFPLPAPYVTVDVGTFDAAAGTFMGLKTTVEFDPEPIEHQPGQHPTNPAPKFAGTRWIEVTINARWQRTITSVPAPKVALAPVQLKFSVTNTTAAWSVAVNGKSTDVPAGQTTVNVSIWDFDHAVWGIQAGASSYHDNLKIQRPGQIPAAGGFTIPVIPVAIIYAPPVDSLKLSTASYGIGSTIGTTTSYEFSTDTSDTVPTTIPQFAGASILKGGLDFIATVLGDTKAVGSDPEDPAPGKVLSKISDQIGTLSSSTTTGEMESDGTQITVTDTSSTKFTTNVSGGGPGAGDEIFYLKNVRVIWMYYQGQLQLVPISATAATPSAQHLKGNPEGISADDQARLLALDPFVAGGPFAALPSGPGARFTAPDGISQNVEYGGGVTVDRQYSVTRSTTTTTTDKEYTTEASSWEPGPVLKMLGMGDKTQVTVSQTTATANSSSSTVTLDANLAAGPDDYFAVNIWYDQLFGTWAFQQVPVTPTPLLSGSGAKPRETVLLQAGNQTYMTVADKNGHYTFRNSTIPKGAAKLTVGTNAPTTVTVGPATTKHPLALTVAKKALQNKTVQVTVHVTAAGKPVAGATVSGLPGAKKATNAAGTAVFSEPATKHGNFTVKASKTGFVEAKKIVAL